MLGHPDIPRDGVQTEAIRQRQPSQLKNTQTVLYTQVAYREYPGASACFFVAFARNPIGFRFVVGVNICLSALKTIMNGPSYLFSSSSSRRVSSSFATNEQFWLVEIERPPTAVGGLFADGADVAQCLHRWDASIQSHLPKQLIETTDFMSVALQFQPTRARFSLIHPKL